MSGLWFIGGLGVLAVVIVFVAVRWGKAKAQSDFFEESHDKAKEARKIDEDVARLSDPALDDELRHPK